MGTDVPIDDVGAGARSYRGILVTGGAGFVGSNLALSLKADFPDARVVALDNLKRRGSELNVPRLRAGGVEFVHGDVRSPDDLASVPRECDLLVECSAEPSVLAGYDESPAYVLSTNLVGTIHCLEWARRQSADVVFLSTSRVYPAAPQNALAIIENETRFELADEQPYPGVSSRGISEAFPLEGARSLYGATKLASELLIEEYRAIYGLRTIVNRCGVLTGPWQMGKVEQGVFSLWVLSHFFKRPLKYVGFGGTGKQVRDFLHVRDLHRLLKIELRDLDRLTGSVFNVGGGRPVSLSLREATELCRQITGNRISIESVTENRVADLPIYLTDNGRVHAATGWSALETPERTLADIHAWVRENERSLQMVLG
jgi:CDP-paratose 2-epimerase